MVGSKVSQVPISASAAPIHSDAIDSALVRFTGLQRDAFDVALPVTASAPATTSSAVTSSLATATTLVQVFPREVARLAAFPADRSVTSGWIVDNFAIVANDKGQFADRHSLGQSTDIDKGQPISLSRCILLENICWI